jgi:REP element-mobilizing transposase RayT
VVQWLVPTHLKEKDMSEYIHKSHNVSVLLYHYVCPAKYRRKIFTETVDKALKEVCVEISERYEINFIEIGSDSDHVHFLIQSVPTMSPTRIVTILKSITAREIFKRRPEVKKQLWGGNLWTSGYFVSTVGRHGNEKIIEDYVKSQGKEYKQIHREDVIV